MFPLCVEDEGIAGAPGKFVELDDPGRRMYYSRTGNRCPACGLAEKRPPDDKTAPDACPECGRTAGQQSDAADQETSDVLTEIDALIDSLDDMGHGD